MSAVAETTSVEEQIFLRDLGSYIRVARQIGRPTEEILGTIAHDVSGVVAYGHSEAFVPRSGGYYEMEVNDYVGCDG